MPKSTSALILISLISALAHAQAPATSTATSKVAAPKPTTSSATEDAQGTSAAVAAATSTTTVKAEEAPKLKFSLDMGIAYNLGAEAQPDGTRVESIDYSFTPGMSYDVYKASVFNLYSQDLKDTSKNGTFIDPAWSFSRTSFALNDYFKLGPALSLTLPMTDSSKNNTELLYQIGGSLGLYLQTKQLGLDSWDIGYYVGYVRNFTKYATTAAGDPVTMQRIRQRINVAYHLTDKLSIKTRFQFDSKYSSEGVIRNDFLHYENLVYDINSTFSVSVGHSYTNSLLDGTTYENNLRFYDEKKSQYAAELDISI
jgi:hypothetical protein